MRNAELNHRNETGGGGGCALLINLVCQSYSHEIIGKLKYTDVIVQVVNAKYLSMFKWF